MTKTGKKRYVCHFKAFYPDGRLGYDYPECKITTKDIDKYIETHKKNSGIMRYQFDDLREIES